MRPSSRGLVVALLAAAACKSSEPFSPQPTTVTISPTVVNLSSLGLSQQLTATVADQHGTPISGVTVTWSTNNGAIATVSPSGLVTSAGFGSAKIMATAGTATGSVNAVVAPGSGPIRILSGDAQSGTVTTALVSPLTVLVVDNAGAPITGATVTFFALNGGTPNPASPATGSNGQASSTFTLDTAAGPKSIRASVVINSVTSQVLFGATANPGPPASMVAAAGDSQHVLENSTVPVAPAVRVRDQYNNPLAGVSVTFAAESGGGGVTGANQPTNGSGVATVGSWTVGTGMNTLLASATGVTPFRFHARTSPLGPPSSMTIVAGDGQTGLENYPVNIPPAVQIKDTAGFPVSNILVTFAVMSGGGSVTGDTVRTGSNGTAAVGSWTIQLGSNTLGASIPDAGVTGNPATFSAGGAAAAYHVDVRFLSVISPSRHAVFDSAAARWERAIFGDVADVPVNIPGDTLKKYCTGKTTPDLNETIDDVVIFASLDSIDGPGKILGRAGPCFIRTAGFLPLIGVMQFDTADVANLESNGLFDEVILHEMGHVLGYGTIWSSNFLNLLVGPASLGGTDPHFVGSLATAAFNRIGGAGYSAGAKIPVENTGGAGTRDSHWRETVFTTELMTGFLNPSVPNPLSMVSIASMGDEGYQVNYAAADTFTLPFGAALRAQSGGQTFNLGDDVLRLPLFTVDRQGRMKKVTLP